jgi:hypothetical protein
MTHSILDQIIFTIYATCTRVFFLLCSNKLPVCISAAATDVKIDKQNIFRELKISYLQLSTYTSADNLSFETKQVTL